MKNREQLIVENMGLANKMAWDRKGANDLQDLRAAAYEGLIKAVDKYDESRGKFSSFASFYIRTAICVQKSHQANLLYVPYEVSRETRYMLKFEERGEIYATRYRRSRKTLLAAANQKSVDIDSVAEISGSNLNCADVDIDMSHVKGSVSKREYDILIRHADGETYQSIGGSYGLSQQRVRQIEKAAIKRLNSELAC